MQSKLDGDKRGGNESCMMSGHDCNLFLCRSLVVLRILMRETMMLYLFITDLMCLHFYY